MTKGAISQQDTALVSFMLGREESLAFVLEGGQPQAEVLCLPCTRDEVVQAAGLLDTYFASGRIHARRPERTTDMAWLRPLAGRLLAPLDPLLSRCRSLVVAPHAELHRLPLQLLEREGGPPLGVTHAITYVASLSLYGLVLKNQAEPAPQGTRLTACLTTAAAGESDLAHETFALAPSRFAHRVGSEIYQGVGASIPRLRELGAQSDILYLSCHGLFDPKNPLDSCLLLSDGQTLPRHDGSRSVAHRLTVRDLLALRLGSRLVLLQACTSGAQDFSPGDEPMGFPTALLLAGAQTIVASNWIVERNAAAAFMDALAEHWVNQGTGIGEAVRRAYAVTRDQYPHPFHWAAFSLFGNDRLLYHPSHSRR